MRVLAVAAAFLLVLCGSPAQAGRQVGLKGQLAGVVTDHAQPPDVPTEHELTGTGRTNLGPTSAHGTVQGTGFVQLGSCSGRLLLTTPHGTLTLRVSSARLAAFSECPTNLIWRITAGTGALAGSSGSGTMHLSTTARAFRLVFDGPATAPPPTLATTGSPGGLATAAVLLLLAAGLACRLRAGSAAPVQPAGR